jgi:glycosyltransferase involved in cell wall biosynthesis
MDQLKCCVIIPTYNNHKTLKRVIEGVLQYTQNVIVVNDGSTDTTSHILTSFHGIHSIPLPHNIGKGYALRKGFELALELGFHFAITIDSDGQHFPDDIPLFINSLSKEKSKDILYIGARNMGQKDVPKKSSFGNKFSNFWFWVETGNKLQDTQSGYRLYPILALKNMKFFTKKFEFEIEAIVKAAWNGIEVKNIPIKVTYDVTERVSHFRPFTDFSRISLLNTYLVILTLLYIFPRDLIRKIKKKGVKRFFHEDFLGSNDSHEKKALSIALGVLIGLSPLWGFQTLIVIFLAVLFKLNKTIAFAFSNVSFPPFIPFVLYISLKIGHWVLGNEFNFTFEEAGANFEVIKHLKSYIIGSITLSLIGAFAAGICGYIILNIFDRKKIALKNG